MVSDNKTKKVNCTTRKVNNTYVTICNYKYGHAQHDQKGQIMAEKGCCGGGCCGTK